MERLTYWGSVTFFCLLLLDRPIIIFIVKKHPQYKDLVCLQFDIVYWQVFLASTFPFPKTLNQLWIKYKGLIVVSNLSGSGTGKVTGTSGIVEEQLIPQLHLVQPQSLDVVLELGKLGIKRSLLCGQLNILVIIVRAPGTVAGGVCVITSTWGPVRWRRSRSRVATSGGGVRSPVSSMTGARSLRFSFKSPSPCQSLMMGSKNFSWISSKSKSKLSIIT